MVTGLTQFEPRRLRQELINRDAFDGGRDLGLVTVFRDDSHRRWIGNVWRCCTMSSVNCRLLTWMRTSSSCVTWAR